MELGKNINKEAVILARDLYFVFGLRKYSKGEYLLTQVKELKDRANEGLLAICHFIQRECCKYKKAPLWSLKYSDYVAGQDKEEKQAFYTMIDGMTNLLQNGYDGEVVHNINLVLRIYKYDFSYICTRYLNNNLLEGFRNYISTNSIVYMDCETLNDVIDYIRRNATSPIYLLTEKEVIIYIEQWQIPCLNGIVYE